MATLNQTTPVSKLNRKVLLQAWAILSVHDRTAATLKGRFIHRRNQVIALTLASTTATVLTGIMGQTTLSIILAIIGIALPVVGTFLMNDIVRFTGTTSWIKNRYIAEMMRMHVYLYRMGAGSYTEARGTNRDDNLLVENLNNIRKDCHWDEVIPPSVKVSNTDESIIETISAANSSTPDDDGLNEISVENYIKWRVDKQAAWYDGKVDEDFTRLKLYIRSAQIFLFTGSLISALAGFINIQVVALVAVTNSISVALTQWSNVSMYGKTYALFQIAAQQLYEQKMDWDARENDQGFSENRSSEIATFAERVENVLLWERQEWYELVLQAQANSDRLILGDLARLTQRAEDAQKKPPA